MKTFQFVDFSLKQLVQSQEVRGLHTDQLRIYRMNGESLTLQKVIPDSLIQSLDFFFLHAKAASFILRQARMCELLQTHSQRSELLPSQHTRGTQAGPRGLPGRRGSRPGAKRRCEIRPMASEPQTLDDETHHLPRVVWSSAVERLVVAQEVAGANPVTSPIPPFFRLVGEPFMEPMELRSYQLEALHRLHGRPAFHSLGSSAGRAVG